MKMTLSFIIVFCAAPMLCGQNPIETRSSDDKVVQDLIEKIRDLQPPVWTYADLAAKSDLVAIAKLKSRSTMSWTDDIGVNFGKESADMIVNHLSILSVLKGRALNEIDLITLEWKTNIVVLTNHDFAELRSELLLPNLARVTIDGEIAGYAGSQGMKTRKIEPEYLLFLRRTNDDRYVPVTGQRYSGMSVRILNN